MQRKLWCIGLLLLSILAAGSAAFAGEEPAENKDALDKMFSEGWMPVAPGVLQRHAGESRVETFAIGVEGLRWGVKELEARLQFLEGEYQEHPSEDLRRAIQGYRKGLAKLRKDIERAKKNGEDESPADLSEKEGCSVSFSSSAEADYLTSTQGVTANASAIFNNSCGLEATINAEAYATATKSNGVEENVVQTNGLKSGLNVSSTATATVAGGSPCSSSAYSWVRVGGDILISAYELNSECPVKLALAPITGPTSVSFGSSAAACQSKTWSTAASGGTPPYSYTWSVGGVEVGAGTSYIRQVCSSDGNFTLTVTVADSTTPTPQSGTQTLAVTVVPPLALAAITGPTSVSFSSPSAACETKTWSTSASGGSAPHSYTWSVGSTQVGTGASYSRQVCPSDASFTLTATVIDSTTPTLSSTQNLAVTVSTASMALAPITGVSGIALPSPWGSSCESTTWSTSASGGTSPYSYKWFVNGGQVGTGTSYTRRLCAQDADFTLTATATDSATPTPLSATQTLTVAIVPPLTQDPITGPTSVSFASSTAPCESKTWSASASGGLLPYSYKWSIGGVQVGTGSSYTRQVCPTDASFNLISTVTDSITPTPQSASRSRSVTISH